MAGMLPPPQHRLTHTAQGSFRSKTEHLQTQEHDPTGLADTLGTRLTPYSVGMDSTNHWVSVNREDGERVGYLEPLSEDYSSVQPRTVLGHKLGDPCEYIEGEDLLVEHGISELAEKWTLDDGTNAQVENLTIVELSPHGIILADYYSSKAVAAGERLSITLQWPDLNQRLTVA